MLFISRSVLLDFLTNEEQRHVFVFYNKTILHATQEAPANVEGKFIIFLKVNNAVKITRENINNELYYLEWSKDFLHHFENVVRHVFLPVLSEEQSGGVSCDRLMDLLHRILNCSTVMSGKVEVLNVQISYIYCILIFLIIKRLFLCYHLY